MPSISGKQLPKINDVVELFDLRNDRSYDSADSKRQTQSLLGTKQHIGLPGKVKMMQKLILSQLNTFPPRIRI